MRDCSDHNVTCACRVFFFFNFYFLLAEASRIRSRSALLTSRDYHQGSISGRRIHGQSLCCRVAVSVEDATCELHLQPSRPRLSVSPTHWCVSRQERRKAADAHADPVLRYHRVKHRAVRSMNTHHDPSYDVLCRASATSRFSPRH